MSLLFFAALACVPKKDLESLSAQLEATHAELTAELDTRRVRIAELEAELAAQTASAAAMKQELAGLSAQLAALNAEKAALVKDRSRLASSVEEMESALNEMTARKRATEQRVAQYRDLLSRFQSLIDAGQLQVKIVDGRMVVQLATDILFASGSAELSDTGAASLASVAAVLADIPDRHFQIEGHTDNVPISTTQYPSNWELASARAIVVLNAMLDAGLRPSTLSAASFADTHPVASNDTKAGRAQNRRIEIVVVPDLSQLPGFAELQSVAGE